MATRCSEATPPGAHRLDKAGRWSGDDDELDVFAAERYFNGDDAALWCARSSSSFSSAFRTTGTYEHDRSVATATVATSSSEASWNSRSVLLPDDGKVLAVTATAPPSLDEAAEFRGTGRRSERPRERPSPPSSHLRRWLLGVAGCACIGGDREESAACPDDLCRDEVVEEDKVAGIAGEQKRTDGAGELCQRMTESKQLPVVEATSVKARPARWLEDGEGFVVGEAGAFSPSQVAGDGHRHAVKSGEFSRPIFNPATTAAPPAHERQDSAFAMLARNTACGGVLNAAVAGGGRSATPRRPGGTGRCDPSEDDSAPSELGCAYAPSEASVDWSVVTAEGAAPCNLSSAASGYYYLNGALRHAGAAGRTNRRRRCGVTNSGGLLTCMGDKAVDAVRPARTLALPPWSAGHSG